MAVFGIGLAFLTIWLYSTASSESRSNAAAAQAKAIAVSQREAAVAERKASARAGYRTCVVGIPLLRQVNTTFATIKTTLLRNAADMHRLTPRSAPTYRQQIINIARLRKIGVKLPVPTKRSCAARRDRLLRR